MQLTPITIICLVGALCAATLDNAWGSFIFLAAALINTAIMMWALAPEEGA